MAEKQDTTGTLTPTNSRSDNDLESFKQFHDEAYLYVSHAITMEEENEPKGALILYERALRLIDQALSLLTEGPGKTGPKWEKIRTEQIKMRQTRLQIFDRLIHLRTAHSPPESERQPPSYAEATRPHWSNANEMTATNGQHQTLQEKVSEMAAAMQGVEIPPPEISSNAQIIFTLEQVQLFFVSPDGFVSAPSYPTSLTVYKFVEGNDHVASNKVQPSGWIQVGTWVYPLVPGHSPVLQTNYGAYMFPDTSCHQAGAAVGLLIPDSVEDDDRIILENILCELTSVRQEGTIITSEEVVAERERLSKKISAGIVRGAELLAVGVNYGATVTSKLVHFGANALRQKIDPTNRPISNIDPRVQKGLYYAREATGVAVSASSFIVCKVADATSALGRFLAPHIRHHGAVLLSKVTKKEPKAVDNKVDDVFEVASGSLRGFATIYVSLESAARLLASSLANETVQTVNYRYGCAVGDVTDSAVKTVGNIAMAAYNLNAVGVKGIAKRAAKNTGKALIEDYENKQSKRITKKNDDENKK